MVLQKNREAELKAEIPYATEIEWTADSEAVTLTAEGTAVKYEEKKAKQYM